MKHLVEKLPSTTGARDNQRDKGTVCPRTNWVAAALKKGSKAALQLCDTEKNQPI
jgi:hypothetical protein